MTIVIPVLPGNVGLVNKKARARLPTSIVPMVHMLILVLRLVLVLELVLVVFFISQRFSLECFHL